MATRVLDDISNKIGTFTSSSLAPPTGTRTATLTALMTVAEAHDPTDTCRLGIEADFGAGFRHAKWGDVFTGGPGKSAPTLSWQFDPANPPLAVRGVLENRTQVVAGLNLSFTA